MRSFLAVSCLLFLASCAPSHYLSQGRAFKLTPVSFDELNGWKQDSLLEALPAMKRSCTKHPEGFENFCTELSSVSSEKDLRKLVENNLQPYKVTSRGSDRGKITGYYEAELTGTRQHENGVQMPIYGVPAGYQNGDKYPTRASIENKGLKNADIIAWADNPVDLFIMHVQGSGRMTTPDGEVIQLGYAGNNGRTFSGIGTIFKDAGIDPSIANSMSRIREWCMVHPSEATKLMQRNERYIFFKELSGDGPIGSAGVALTPQRSLAVDAAYIPMHTPMWLETTKPNGEVIQRLMVAQDTGAAIKGGIRADFFWGYGTEAFQTAGHMNQSGSYYLLLPKK